MLSKVSYQNFVFIFFKGTSVNSEKYKYKLYIHVEYWKKLIYKIYKI